MTNNTLDKILHRLAQYYEAVGRSKASPNKTDFAKAKKEIESLIADREKQMLEFVIGPDREVKGNYDYQINEEKAKARQRAKEWRER